MPEPRDPLFDVSGCNVLVIGGGAGLGRFIAEAFAARGARCTVADLDRAHAAETVEALAGDGHDHCAVDVRDRASCREAVTRAAGTAKRLDVMINCAGRFHTAPALEMEQAAFESVLDINTKGAFIAAREAGRVMTCQETGGRIITLSSVSSQVVNPDYAAYATSKGALTQLTRVLALEWAANAVTVNAVGPALTLTPMTEAYLSDPAHRQYALDCIPMGRFGRPDDILGALLLLASDAGRFITGQTLYVDGGRTLR